MPFILAGCVAIFFHIRYDCLKLVLCGVDLSFHTIDYLLSASFPLYGIQLCYFSLIYSLSLPASLVITFCCLVLSFISELLLLMSWCMHVKSVLNLFCLSISFLLHVIYIFLLDYVILYAELPSMFCSLIRIYLDEVCSIYI